MKKLLVPLAVIAMLALAVPVAFAEAELGMGWSPSQNAISTSPDAVNSIINFHVGYSWEILYLSWDAYALPDYWIYNYVGDPVPGFMNLFDVGLKLVLKPFIGYVEVGTNALYLYGGQFYTGGFGVNTRAGAGVKFGWWGVNVSGTQTFANWSDMGYAFRQASKGDWSVLGDGALLTFNFVLYF